MADIKIKLQKTDGNELILNDNYIDDIVSTSQSTTDPSIIQYGALLNTGSITIRDIDNKLKDVVNNGELDDSKTTLKLILNNKQIQEHTTSDNNYNVNDSILSTQLSDNLYKLNLIFTNQFLEYGYTGYKVSFYYLIDRALTNSNFDDVMSISKSEFINKLTNESIIVLNKKITIETYLKRIIIDDGTAYIKQSSLYDFLDKIAKATQLSLIKFDNGDIKFISQRPISLDFDTSANIKNKDQITLLDSNLFINNKIKKINYNRNSISTSFIDAANANINLYTENGVNLKILDNGQIISKDGRDYLCFFYTINSSDIMLTNTAYSIDNIKSSTIIVSSFDNKISKSGTVANFYSVENNKNDFNFNEYLGGHEVLSPLSTGDSLTMAFSIDITDIGVDYIGNIEIHVYPRTIKQNLNVTYYGANTNSNIYDFEYINEYIADNIKYYLDDNLVDYIFMYDLIMNNILNDYYDGISTAQIDLFCQDMYNINNEQLKSFDSGEILTINDSVNLNNDYNKYGEKRHWSITDRTFKYSGYPYLSLTLRELKKPRIRSGLYADSNYINQLYSWEELISNNIINISNNNTITSFNNEITGYLSLDDSIQIIDENAFMDSKLNEIILNEHLTNINKGAFKFMLNLSSIIIPKYASNIGELAFSGCINLKSITFNEGIVSLGQQAFNGCSSLNNIILPNTLRTINPYCFNGCTSLNEVIFKNTSGWTVNGNPINVADSAVNANNLKSNYRSAVWARN